MTLTEKLAALLTEAGLPPERELFGKPFAFTYKNKDGDMETRISGIIMGIKLDSDSFRPDFELLTSYIPQTRVDDTYPPAIIFLSADEDTPAHWRIIYRHNDNNGRYDRKATERLVGEFVLL